MPKFFDVSIKSIQQEAITAVFTSIQEKGLVSPKARRGEILTTLGAGTNRLDENLCVNYVNLSAASKAETTVALEAALYEEYLGVSGISLERQWPFQRASSATLLPAEITERLMNNILFIIKPPKIHPLTTKVHGGHTPAKIAFYDPAKKDGFSQARGRNLLTGAPIEACARVTEIKTTKAFAKADLLGVLVPEHLYALASGIFTDLEVIPVPTRAHRLHALPEILKIYFDETLHHPMDIGMPDYFAALSELITRKALPEFSLHAVRLHSEFDFIARPITTVSTQAELLAKVNAKIVQDLGDDRAWVVVHKHYGTSQKKLLQTLAEKGVLPLEYLTQLALSSQPSIELFDALSALKGPLVMSNIYSELTPPQIQYLVNLKMDLIKTGSFYVIQYPKPQAAQIIKVIDDFPKIQVEAATQIQALYRGHRCRFFVSEYKKAAAQLALAQQAFDKAAESLSKISLSF